MAYATSYHCIVQHTTHAFLLRKAVEIIKTQLSVLLIPTVCFFIASMTLKNKISGFLILLMLSMQLLLAQHYTVHFQQDDEHIGISQNHEDGHGAPIHDDHKPTPDKICQICVFSKSFSHLLLSSFAAVLVIACLTGGVFFLSEQFFQQNNPQAYSARGPPAFLS